MSNRLLNLAWAARISPTEKVVLAALADRADNDGKTWIAIRSKSEKMDLLTMTSLSERAIQGAIKALCEAEHLSRVETPGKGVTYTVHPRSRCTPAQDEPPQEVRPAAQAPTPAVDAPKPPVTPIASQEASPPSKARARKSDYHRLPDDWEPTRALPAPLQQRIDQWPPGREADQLAAFQAWAANAKDEDGKGRKLDWDKAWQNWLRDKDERHRSRNYNSTAGAGTGRTVAAAGRAIARMAGGRTS